VKTVVENPEEDKDSSEDEEKSDNNSSDSQSAEGGDMEEKMDVDSEKVCQVKFQFIHGLKQIRIRKGKKQVKLKKRQARMKQLRR